MPSFQLIPDARFADSGSAPFAPASRDALVRASRTPTERQEQTAAAGDIIPILYGEDVIAPAVARVLSWNGSLVVLYVWGYGPYEQQVWLKLNDGNPNIAGVTWEHYLGTQLTASPILIDAYAANGKTWNKVLPNVVYSVGRFAPGAAVGGVPRPVARYKGRKLLDPRTGLTVWSDNPALALRDFAMAARRTSYGCGLTIPDADVIACADECDAMIGSPAEKRRTINLNIDSRADADSWLDTLRTLAGCFLVTDSTPARMIPDKDGAVVRTFTRASFKSLRTQRNPRRNRPTVIQVQYTRINATTLLGEEHIAEYVPPEVTAGTWPREVSLVPINGVNRYTQAFREAKERGKKLNNDILIELEVFDEGLELTHGDLIGVTDPNNGWTNRKFRVIDCVPNGTMTYRIRAQSHDAAAYSEDTPSTPSSDFTELEDPRVVPIIGPLTLTETVLSVPSGALPLSRVNVAWDAITDWPFLVGYRVRITNPAGQQVDAADVASASYQSIPLPPFVTYTVSVWARSSVAISATASTAPITLVSLGSGSLVPVVSLPIHGPDYAALGGSLGQNTEVYTLWPGDTTLRIRAKFAPGERKTESEVYAGRNPANVGALATQLLDEVETNVIVADSDAFTLTRVFAPTALGRYVNNAVITLTNSTVVNYVDALSSAECVPWNLLGSPFSVSPIADLPATDGRGMSRYSAASVNSAGLLLVGRFRTVVGGYRARVWSISFPNGRAEALLPSVSDPIPATTSASAGVVVQLPRKYITIRNVQVTAQSGTPATTSYDAVTTSETVLADNKLTVHAYDSAGARVAVPVSITVTGVEAQS